MRRIFYLCFFVLCGEISFAQQTSYFTDPNIDYRQGLELVQQEKYTAAQEKFREAITRLEVPPSASSHELLINARYYDAYCSK